MRWAGGKGRRVAIGFWVSRFGNGTGRGVFATSRLRSRMSGGGLKRLPEATLASPAVDARAGMRIRARGTSFPSGSDGSVGHAWRMMRSACVVHDDATWCQDVVTPDRVLARTASAAVPHLVGAIFEAGWRPSGRTLKWANARPEQLAIWAALLLLSAPVFLLQFADNV